MLYLVNPLTIVKVTTGKVMTMEELSNVQGRAWEDVDVSYARMCWKSLNC